MHLAIGMADWLVDRFASRLNAGRLAIYSSLPPVNGQPLVVLEFQANAFQPSKGTVAEAYPLQPAIVMASGEARTALLMTGSGEVLADVRVKTVDATDAEIGDVLVTRTDFHRGGLCEVGRITLTVPLRTRNA